jgi:hypothetical protein
MAATWQFLDAFFNFCCAPESIPPPLDDCTVFAVLHPPAAPTSSHVAIVSPAHFTLQFDQTPPYRVNFRVIGI